MAIFGYRRVSTRGGQIANHRHELELAGYEVTYLFADEGISSSVPTLQRPQFCALLERIRAWDTLVVSSLCCLGRDARDIGSMIRMLAGRHIDLVVLPLGKLDLRDAAGRMLLGALAALADMESNLSVEPIRSGVACVRLEGKTLGRPRSTTEKQRASIIRRHQAGESISALARAERLSRASIMRIVRPAALQ